MIAAIAQPRNETGPNPFPPGSFSLPSVTDRRYGCGEQRPGSRLRPELADTAGLQRSVRGANPQWSTLTVVGTFRLKYDEILRVGNH